MLYYFLSSVLPQMYELVIYDGFPADVFNVFTVLIGSAATQFAGWLFCYLFMGFGLFTMAKRRNMKIAFLAFIPIASTYLMGKLVGEINLFGLKLKRLGLIVMIIETLVFALTVVEDLAYLPILLDIKDDVFNEQSYIYLVNSLVEIDFGVRVLSMVNVVLTFIGDVAYFILLLYLFRNYAPKSSFMFAILSLFFEFLGPIFVFAIRKNSCEEYRDYMRMKMHSMYGGGNPYQYDDGTYRDPYDLSKQGNAKEEKPESPFGEYEDK